MDEKKWHITGEPTDELLDAISTQLKESKEAPGPGCPMHVWSIEIPETLRENWNWQRIMVRCELPTGMSSADAIQILGWLRQLAQIPESEREAAAAEMMAEL